MKPSAPESAPSSPLRQRPSLSARARTRTTSKQHAFLAAFEDTGTVRAACILTRVGRRTVYDWVERDQHFADAYNLARDAVAPAIRFLGGAGSAGEPTLG